MIPPERAEVAAALSGTPYAALAHLIPVDYAEKMLSGLRFVCGDCTSTELQARFHSSTEGEAHGNNEEARGEKNAGEEISHQARERGR